MPITEEQKRRYTAFWERTPTDRACIYMSTWDGSHGFPKPSSPEQQWGDPDYREAQSVYSIEHSIWHAEGFPTRFTNFGAGCLAAALGASYCFSTHTVWFGLEPRLIEEWEDRKPLALDKASAMYRMVEDLTARTLRYKDLFFTSITDIGGTYDIIASLRGTENLLYDLYDNPEEVKALRAELAPIWKDYFLSYAQRLLREQGGMTSWMPIWSDKSYYPLQCDFAAMISPQMFGEFILPDLREQTEYMERAIYHLDGVGELPHVDQLLSLPRLNAIQWTSGDGRADVGDPCWFELYHRIQKAGKGIVLLGVRPDQLETLFKNVSQRGLFLTVPVRDAQEADEVVKLAEKLNH